MTGEYFMALEAEIPAVHAEAALRAAQVGIYPHLTKEGAERLWRHWQEQANPRPIALPVKGALLSFNGQAVSFQQLRENLAGALGRGLVA